MGAVCAFGVPKGSNFVACTAVLLQPLSASCVCNIMATVLSPSYVAAARCHAASVPTRRRAAAAASVQNPMTKTKNTSAPTAAGHLLHHRRRGPAPLNAASAVSPFADNADDATTAAPPSPELARAQRALRWRHGDCSGNINSDQGFRTGGMQPPPLDVYTEALLAACGACDEDEKIAAAGARTADHDDTAVAAAAEGWSSAGITSVLDHLAFDRLQVIMEKTEVSKGVEVMGMMRQVVVVGAGLDTRWGCTGQVEPSCGPIA